MNSSSTLTLKLNTVNTPVVPAVVKTTAAAFLRRTLIRKWDMIAVVGLMTSSAVYGVYALSQMTGF